MATGWTARVRFPPKQNFSLIHSVQTCSGAHPASYPMCTGADFPKILLLGTHCPKLSNQQAGETEVNCATSEVLTTVF
jgi:hypothetical protein